MPRINFSILWHVVRLFTLFIGAIAILSFFYTLHTFYFLIFLAFLSGAITAFYKLEIAVREYRLRNGWYL